jgi:heat shock protein HtpX
MSRPPAPGRLPAVLRSLSAERPLRPVRKPSPYLRCNEGIGFPPQAGIETEASMARTRYATDKGLIARMGATMFLIGLVFTAFIIVVIVLLTRYSNVGNGGIIFIAILLGGALSFGSYYWSDKIALSTANARLVTPEQAPELHGIIDRICALADMPKPRVAIAPTDLPNAFATGRSSKVAVVCVTQGLLRRLDTNELEGVLAHEMSHVAHKDVAVMTIASFIGIIAALMVRFAFYSELFGGGGGRGRGRGGNNQNALPVILVVMLVGMVVYAISFLLIRMLSRYRELSADRSGALLTGQPSALASALVKVSGEMARIPTRDLRAAEPLNAFYFAPALATRAGHLSLSQMFSTHPSLEKRLKALDQISQQLSKG